MATYKKPCPKCGELIPGDAQFCPFCASADPYQARCPKCRQPVEEGWKICSSCGLKLKTVCATCGRETPTAEKCAACGAPVLVRCKAVRCNEVQIWTRDNKCVKCGKSLK